jgi:ribonuclease R
MARCNQGRAFSRRVSALSMKKSKPKQKNSSTPNGPDWRDRDQQAEVEAQRYAEPIPSRALLLQILAEQPGPLTVDELIGQLGLRRLSEQEALAKRLAAMVREGQLAQNRRGAFGPAQQMNVVTGTVQAHRDGFGFLIPDAGGADVFLPPRQMRALMNGDRVQVRVTGQDYKGRPEGSVVEIIERVTRQVVGRLHEEQGMAYVIPDNPRVQQDLLIPAEERAGSRHGQMVVAEIVTPPGNRTLPVGKVLEILGEHLAPGMEIAAAIRAHNLPHEWPAAVEQEAAAIPDTVHAAQLAGREDIRQLPLVTIDGADARDFDDAVYARAEKKGWTLWVAIADVAAYVRPGTPLDREATARGNSVYFPQQVIPMLPEKLSNGLCSLNPGVDRLCMVCEMRVMPDGEIANARFFEGVMHSKARLIYENVAAVIDPQAPPAERPVPAEVVPHLKTLDAVFSALFAAREKRGAIDFETVETRIVFGTGRKIERIVPVQRNRAHRLIEECMIAANVEAAKFVGKHKLPLLYRVHEEPDAAKLVALREFLSVRGMSLSGGAKPQAMDYAKAAAAARARPDGVLIQMQLLRSMMQARYQPENLGHFGLALTDYAHFTSPIRRYPDLLLHRAIKHALHKRRPEHFEYTAEQMAALGTHCSMSERRADEATRDVATWLKCEFMRHRVGEEFDGTVSAVTSFGLFVTLEGLYIDGLVHVSSLRNDYYEYDNRLQRLVGSRLHQVYALGDGARVRVLRVNLDERKIDLELVHIVSRSGGAKLRPSDSSAKRQPPPRSRRRK